MVALAACPAPEPPPVPIPPVSAGKVRVRVFTEPSAVLTIAAFGSDVFVVTTTGIQHWDPHGQVTILAGGQGLPGAHVVAAVPDDDHKKLWILSDGGLGDYDVSAGVYTEVTPPPQSLGVDYATLAKAGAASLATASEGGVWLGTAKGLLFVSAQGGWLATPIKDPVSALVRDHGGWLWIATKSGLIARKPSGELVKIGTAHGCEVLAPRVLIEAPGDRVFAIGSDAQNHERIAIGKQLAWTSYRTLPEVTWTAATRRGDAILVVGEDRVYRLSTATEGTRPLARDGMRLVSLVGGGESDWAIDSVDMVLPAGTTALAGVGDQLYVGTRDLGVARFDANDPHPRGWLRTKQMFEGATRLTVACARQNECWLAFGGSSAWHWSGDQFERASVDEIVLAVAHDPAGPIYALHRGRREHAIHVSRLDGATWTPLPKLDLATPGDEPGTTFARFATTGTLWVGLSYGDGNERHAFGVAIVEPTTGRVSYHRTGPDKPDKPYKKDKMFPIPVGVVGADVRGDTAWFATNEGVARLVDGQVQLWTEADGLRSELARAVTIAPDGSVIVATGGGAGVWNGRQWDFPVALRFAVNDVVATKNGQIWMATERGIAAWDGKTVRRVDVRRGLAENSILDITADSFDRVWARGGESLTLVSQTP
jgi:hypothetical protein